MPFIVLHQVGVLTPVPLFQNLSLTLSESCRLGVVANNGAGKSTLLRCLAGKAEPTSGRLSRSKGLRLGYVEQTAPDDLLAFSLRHALRSALREGGLPRADAQDEQETRWRIEYLFDVFEIPKGLQEVPLRQLSGGWLQLARLAQAWAAAPEALLLDEPTNHLDLSKIRFLERWLDENAATMPMAIVSHDRNFLDNSTTHTLFLRPETSKLYACPYSQAKRLLSQDDDAQACQRAREVKEAWRLRRSASALKNIGINSRSDAAQKKAKHLADRAQKIEAAFAPVYRERHGHLKLASRTTHARVLLSVNDAVVRTPEGACLFKTGKLRVLQGDRLVLLGDNGAGKSQFVRLILDAYRCPNEAAPVQFHPTVVVGYADQHRSDLPEAVCPFDAIAQRFRLNDQRIRTLLAGAGFSLQRQNSAIRTFSPGEKARLCMLVLRLTEPNFYLLDEPTNHVDIAGQEKLETEILTQEATCLLVSHDRRFVQNIGTRYLSIENGKLREVDVPYR